MNFVQYEDNIILIVFESQLELTKTMLRPQEFYESPEFKGKAFLLKDFKEWYKTTTPHKDFTYFSDWAGFNIPK